MCRASALRHPAEEASCTTVARSVKLDIHADDWFPAQASRVRFGLRTRTAVTLLRLSVEREQARQRHICSAIARSPPIIQGGPRWVAGTLRHTGRMEAITLLEWDGPAPTLEEWTHEAGPYATVLRYQGHEPSQQVAVISWERQGATMLSPRRGIIATSVEDAMGAAVAAAVSIIRELVRDWSAIRPSAKRELDAAVEGWHPTTLNVDGMRLVGRQRKVLDLAWAAVTEFPGYCLAAAGSNAIPPDLLQFTTGGRARAA